MPMVRQLARAAELASPEDSYLNEASEPFAIASKRARLSELATAAAL